MMKTVFSFLAMALLLAACGKVTPEQVARSKAQHAEIAQNLTAELPVAIDVCRRFLESDQFDDAALAQRGYGSTIVAFRSLSKQVGTWNHQWLGELPRDLVVQRGNMLSGAADQGCTLSLLHGGAHAPTFAVSLLSKMRAAGYQVTLVGQGEYVARKGGRQIDIELVETTTTGDGIYHVVLEMIMTRGAGF